MGDAVASSRSAGPGVHFLTFGTEDFERAARTILVSAERLRFFASQRAVRFADIAAHDFVRRRPWIRPGVRGCGFWAWKPLIIKEALLRVPQGDVVLYCDAGRGSGRRFVLAPKQIVRHALRAGGMCPGVLVPQFGPNRYWTHGACFDALGCSKTSDPGAFEAPQIQATFSAWQHRPATLEFVERWLELCGELAVVGDSDDAQNADFVEHRHDQSVCTLLAQQHALQPIHLTNPAIVHVVYRGRQLKGAPKDINFVELALREPTGLAALAYRGWKSTSLLLVRSLRGTRIAPSP